MTEQWKRILNLLAQPRYHDMIDNFYRQPNFNLMCRHYLDEALAANQDWFTLDNVDNGTMQSHSRELVGQALNHIQTKANLEDTDSITRHQMLECVKAISMLEPVHLVKIVQCCLQNECAILQQYEHDQSTSPRAPENENHASCINGLHPAMSSNELKILSDLENFLEIRKRNSSEIVNDLNDLKNKFCDLNEIERNLQILAKIPNNNGLVDLNGQLEECKSVIKSLNEKINTQLFQLIDDLLKVNNFVEVTLLQRFEGAKIEREDRVRASANGVFQDVGVKILEELVHRICEVLLQTIIIATHILRQNMRLGNLKEKFEGIKSHSKLLLQRLVMQSLLVEMQPPQVIKTNAKFRASVRLATGVSLELSRLVPSVRTILVNEEQLKRLTESASAAAATALVEQEVKKVLHSISISSAGYLTGNEGNLESSQAGLHALVALLGNLKLCKITRSPDRRGISLEEKFCLIFYTQFTVQIGDEQLEMLAWTSSLPLVVVVHDLQKTQAEGPILWDNAFHLSKRSGFEVHQEVPWDRLAFHLQSKFKKMTRSCERERGLTDKQLAYLKQKLFSSTLGASTSSSNQQLVTYEMFLRTNFSNERQFTFWEWFWQAVKAIKEDMREEWLDGLIEGFIDKSEVELLLLSCDVLKTFVIRFIDSSLGYVCCHYLAQSNESNKRYVCHPKPYSRAELSQRALSLRIRDAMMLQYLYKGFNPRLDKKSVFEKHWIREGEKEKKKNPTLSGYCERQQLEITAAEEIFDAIYLSPTRSDRENLNRIESMEDLFNPPDFNSPPDFYNSPDLGNPPELDVDEIMEALNIHGTII